MPEDSSSSPAESPAPDEENAEPMSRAERRAAARHKGKTPEVPPAWSHGKVDGARGSQSTRRQYSTRRSGG